MRLEERRSKGLSKEEFTCVRTLWLTSISSGPKNGEQPKPNTVTAGKVNMTRDLELVRKLVIFFDEKG